MAILLPQLVGDTDKSRGFASGIGGPLGIDAWPLAGFIGGTSLYRVARMAQHIGSYAGLLENVCARRNRCAPPAPQASAAVTIATLQASFPCVVGAEVLFDAVKPARAVMGCNCKFVDMYFQLKMRPLALPSR